jgi:D-alanyl-D-alanine carboxypeptidase
MPDYPDYMINAKTKAEMLDIIYNMASDFEPGSQSSYSNSGYVLLGFIIELLDQATYADSLQNRIVNPLKLKHTAYGDKIDVKNNEAMGMIFQEGKWQNFPETHMSVPHAAGAIVSTSAEVAQFLQALFTGKLVSEDSLDKMMDVQEGYGLGVLRFPFYDRFAYGHTGGIDGFSTITGYFPEDNMAFATLSNALKMNLNDTTIAVLSAYFNRDFEIPEFTMNTLYLSPKELEVFVGNYGTPQLPIDLKFFVDGQTLFAQGTNQSAFPLTPVSKQKFVFERAGIEIEFNDKRDGGKAIEFMMRQGGGSFPFSRKD